MRANVRVTRPFQPFLRGFVTVERLLPEVEKEGFFSRHVARPAAVLDRNHTVEDPRVGQAFALALRPTLRPWDRGLDMLASLARRS